MDTTLNLSVTPTASSNGSIDLPPLSKEPPRPQKGLLLKVGAWSIVAIAVILAFRAAWRWAT